MIELVGTESSELVILISMILLISSISVVSASIYILDVDYFHEFIDELNRWDEFGPYQGSAARVWITDLIPDNAHVGVQIARYEVPWLLPYWEVYWVRARTRVGSLCPPRTHRSS